MFIHVNIYIYISIVVVIVSIIAFLLFITHFPSKCRMHIQVKIDANDDFGTWRGGEMLRPA